MNPVKTKDEVENAARNAAQALYGKDIQDFRVRTLLLFPNDHKPEAWDTQVVFLSNGLQYTVDLLINQKSGEITNARLIDTMMPL